MEAIQIKKYTLFLHHNIFLSKEQRYELVKNKKDIKVMGTSVSVWVFEAGDTSEPATEVFCEYTLTNHDLYEKDDVPIAQTKTGYIINLPNPLPKAPPKDWHKLTTAQKEIWYQDNPLPPNANNLLDPEDKGGRYIRFKENNYQKINENMIYLIHVVEIQDIEYLNQSLLVMGNP